VFYSGISLLPRAGNRIDRWAFLALFTVLKARA
jgi:hypothetical protein